MPGKNVAEQERKTGTRSKLHQENKTIRQIAKRVQTSFKDIGVIIIRIDGRTDGDDDIDPE